MIPIGTETAGPLNDIQIVERCRGNAPMIAPFAPMKVREVDGRRVVSYGLGHFGYDLRLGSECKFVPDYKRSILDPHEPDENVWMSVCGAPYFDIPPRSFVLAHSIEYIRMPVDVFALVTGKSTYARMGVIANVTPMEPGWEGQLTIELSNTAPVPARVWVGEGIVQCVFFAGEQPSQTYAGLYTGQTGATIGRV